ncbi:hypothetical protein D9M71_138190 [compost metagenome]
MLQLFEGGVAQVVLFDPEQKGAGRRLRVFVKIGWGVEGVGDKGFVEDFRAPMVVCQGQATDVLFVFGHHARGF